MKKLAISSLLASITNLIFDYQANKTALNTGLKLHVNWALESL